MPCFPRSCSRVGYLPALRVYNTAQPDQFRHTEHSPKVGYLLDGAVAYDMITHCRPGLTTYYCV